MLPYTLKIIGCGPLENEMKKLAKSNIEFIGYQSWEKIKEIAGKSRFNVLSSEVFENNPLSIIEAQCLGTPVLGARIGGIPELITEGINGMCFESKNVNDLKEKIQIMFQSQFNYENIAQTAQEKYNAENYYQQLINIYK